MCYGRDCLHNPLDDKLLWQWYCHLHLPEGQVCQNSLKHVCCQPSLLWLVHDVDSGLFNKSTILNLLKIPESRLLQLSSMYSPKDTGCGALWVKSVCQSDWNFYCFFQGCKLYGFAGALFGTASIMTMIVIGYDRYNVIVKVSSVIFLCFVWLKI